MATDIHTDFDKRRYDGLGASIGHVQPGKSVADIISDLISGANALRSGTATIDAAAASEVVAIGAAYDGKPATAMVMQVAADATLLRIERVEWDGSGNLEVHGNAAATAPVTIAWFVDGRA